MWQLGRRRLAFIPLLTSALRARLDPKRRISMAMKPIRFTFYADPENRLCALRPAGIQSTFIDGEVTITSSIVHDPLIYADIRPPNTLVSLETVGSNYLMPTHIAVILDSSTTGALTLLASENTNWFQPDASEPRIPVTGYRTRLTTGTPFSAVCIFSHTDVLHSVRFNGPVDLPQ